MSWGHKYLYHVGSILFLQILSMVNKKIKPGNHFVIPYVSVKRQLMLGTGYPLTSQSNTTVCPTEPAKFLGADLIKGAENEKNTIIQ